MSAIKITTAKVSARNYMIWVNDNYIGTFNKTIANMKIKALCGKELID